MTQPPKSHTITIEDDGKSGRHATPSPLLVRGMDSIKFYNKTQDVVHIQFSKMGVFGQARLNLPPGSDESLPTNNPPDLIVCPYAVFCKDINNFAHGTAMPIIIVDPKT